MIRSGILGLLLMMTAACDKNLERIVITTSHQSKVVYRAEVADSFLKREKGLQNRATLADGRGMIFVFLKNGRTAFWMKDTRISLDMLFIRDGRIVDIADSKKPLSEDLIIPSQDYRYVLEIPGGDAVRHGINVGDAIEVPPLLSRE